MVYFILWLLPEMKSWSLIVIIRINFNTFMNELFLGHSAEDCSSHNQQEESVHFPTLIMLACVLSEIFLSLDLIGLWRSFHLSICWLCHVPNLDFVCKRPLQLLLSYNGVDVKFLIRTQWEEAFLDKQGPILQRYATLQARSAKRTLWKGTLTGTFATCRMPLTVQDRKLTW